MLLLSGLLDEKNGIFSCNDVESLPVRKRRSDQKLAATTYIRSWSVRSIVRRRIPSARNYGLTQTTV